MTCKKAVQVNLWVHSVQYWEKSTESLCWTQFREKVGANHSCSCSSHQTGHQPRSQRTERLQVVLPGLWEQRRDSLNVILLSSAAWSLSVSLSTRVPFGRGRSNLRPVTWSWSTSVTLLMSRRPWGSSSAAGRVKPTLTSFITECWMFTEWDQLCTYWKRGSRRELEPKCVFCGLGHWKSPELLVNVQIKNPILCKNIGEWSNRSFVNLVRLFKIKERNCSLVMNFRISHLKQQIITPKKAQSVN